MIRVVVADDQPLVRNALVGIIDSAADLSVVGAATDGREAVDLVAAHSPDVVLMDVRMPGMDGIAATKAITSAHESRVLILTTFDLDEYVYAALRAGASGFLLKDTPPADLLTAIRVIAAGDALLAPQVTRRLIQRYHRQQPAPELRAVTDREREVLTLVGQGLSNAEIGDALHITPGTAKTHVARLLIKLGGRDRVQLVILAHRYGLAD